MMREGNAYAYAYFKLSRCALVAWVSELRKRPCSLLMGSNVVICCGVVFAKLGWI